MDKDVQNLLSQMDRTTSAARTAAAEIEGAVRSSPYLQNLIRESVDAGSLSRIELVRVDHEGGHYDHITGQVALSPSILDFGSERQRRDALTFVLGHEVGHSLLKRYGEKTENDLDTSLNQLLMSQEDRIDVTQVVKTFVARSRANEGLAEVSGWNALRSRVDAEGGSLVPGALAARAKDVTDCVEQVAKDHYRLKPNVDADHNQRISIGSDGSRIEAMAKCHFDSPRATLGQKGDVDYKHYYAAGALSALGSYVAHYTRQDISTPGNIAIDMKALGLDRTKVEHAGLDFGTYGHELKLWDSRGHGQGVPFVLHASGKASKAHPDAMAATEPPLLADIRRGVRELDASMGRAPDAASERMTASLYALARESGLARVDHVVLSVSSGAVKRGENVFVVQGGLTDPTHDIAHMKTAAAVSTPIEHSMQRAAAAEPVREHVPAHAPALDARQHGPTLAHVR